MPSRYRSMKPSKVTLRKDNHRFQLLVNEKPFYIKGAGVDLGNIKSLADFGGNAFRTWRVNNGEKTGLEILDEAHKNGLMVCMGIEVERERHGFDYDNEHAVAEQMAEIKKDILALKDHPALLMWGIGNELNLRHENPKVWDAVNDLSKMIHQIDPNHLTTTMLAGAEPEVITQVAENCPDLDLLSFQIYGAIDKLPNYLQESNYQGAYMITEWGATGHWECENTTWDRPIEANSSKKANDYHSRYIDYIAADVEQCIGSFVFLWGQKQERTPTWYGLFLENEKSTEAAQVMQYLWTGKWAEHRIPKIGALTINNMHAEESVRLEQHKTYDAKIEITNPNKNLSYRWELMKEVDRALQSDGGDFEPTPETVWQQSDSSTLSEVQFSPPETGEFRLFVYVDDCYGGSATANMPILIES
jgi:beta-galactosidase/beta-glucuronidase